MQPQTLPFSITPTGTLPSLLPFRFSCLIHPLRYCTLLTCQVLRSDLVWWPTLRLPRWPWPCPAVVLHFLRPHPFIAAIIPHQIRCSINTIRRHSLLSYSLHYLPNTIQSIHKSTSLSDPNRALDDVDLTTTHAYLSSCADPPLTALNFSTQRSKCRRYSPDHSIALMNRG